MVLGKKAAVAALHWLCPYLTTGVLHSILIASEVAQYVGCGTTTDTAAFWKNDKKEQSARC